MSPGKLQTKQPRNRTRLSLSLVREVRSAGSQGVVHTRLTHTVYNQKTLVAKAAEAQNDQAERIGKVTPEALANMQALDSWEDCEEAVLDGVLDGTHILEISNVGGELSDLIRDMYSDFEAGSEKRTKRIDHHMRQDRIIQHSQAFDLQMPALTHSYLEWNHAQALMPARGHFAERVEAEDLGNGSSAGTWRFCAKGVTDGNHLGAEKVNLVISADDSYITSALVRQGFVPCSPIRPSMAITINALKLYRVARLRSLHFSIQAFVKTICDLQGVAFQRYLSRQFSIALDLYLNILNGVEALIMEALSRTSNDWRLQHACPACTYELKDEPCLKFKILYAMDSNNSLKHILHCIVEDEDSHELPTTQKVPMTCYLSREFVDSFAQSAPIQSTSKDVETGDENPCASRWKNMDEQKTKQTWGVYDETGIFLASGELAKYPIAIVSRLMKVFGADLGGGYDIRCQFSTTLAKSVIGKDVEQNQHTCLVPAFHGHAHWQLCQLSHLTVYTEGLGLEDLETCERTFSKSNALASSLHYASAFHRQQAINAYFSHNDAYEVYASILNFIYSNYKQALSIIQDCEFVLPSLKHELGVTADTEFTTWLQEERNYLEGLEMEPLNETLQMEYWRALVNLEASKKDLDLKSALWDVTTPSDPKDYAMYTRKTWKAETAHRHAVEMYNKDLRIVQDLESKLNIDSRWTPERPKWHDAARLVTKRTFQHALDHLEALVVAWIFELLKMNRVGTGYKMRKHIAKVLQVCSSAIRIALEQYNTAACAMDPPHRILKWDEVVEYAFITEFDLLRDARQDVSQRPWATPAGRSAMDHYFKLLHAREEIKHLEVEACRLLMYLRDEERFLDESEQQARFTSQHLKCLHDITKLPGYKGSLSFSESMRMGPGESASKPHVIILPLLINTVCSQLMDSNDIDTQENLEEEEEEEEEKEETLCMVLEVLDATIYESTT
ncbi:hypothetical protein M404DRAFT_23899 [Pisolithus tinctorius Marx 270]|uniref:CxC1-like cysteine cluster associated with KDZ transposases domain-containing protein n=1 Tax=Pisolithus tinctorius Marx 270 TaxID=870435 RepID=A0A0C3KCS0_PISTI|nr:hypothetical protein M404DRAFT_23899 [Pisolithus tinctorius Marx 270]